MTEELTALLGCREDEVVERVRRLVEDDALASLIRERTPETEEGEVTARVLCIYMGRMLVDWEFYRRGVEVRLKKIANFWVREPSSVTKALIAEGKEALALVPPPSYRTLFK